MQNTVPLIIILCTQPPPLFIPCPLRLRLRLRLTSAIFLLTRPRAHARSRSYKLSIIYPYILLVQRPPISDALVFVFPASKKFMSKLCIRSNYLVHYFFTFLLFSFFSSTLLYFSLLCLLDHSFLLLLLLLFLCSFVVVVKDVCSLEVCTNSVLFVVYLSAYCSFSLLCPLYSIELPPRLLLLCLLKHLPQHEDAAAVCMHAFRPYVPSSQPLNEMHSESVVFRRPTRN